MKPVVMFVMLLAGAGLAVAGEIHDASKAGDLQRVRSLVEATPNCVNVRDRGTTPLHEAARAGHLAVVQYLIEHGANPNVNDISNITPLKLANGFHRTEVSEYLKQQGALERIQNPAQPKAVAAPTVAKLPATPAPAVTLPATPSAPQTSAPGTALVPPAQPLPSPQVTNALPAVPRPSAGEALALAYPIHDAAKAGDVEQIKGLFKAFPDVIEATDEKGQTALHVAIANRQLAAAQTLLGLRAKVNAPSDSRLTPLHLSARLNDLKGVELLLANGANINARDAYDRTPLIMAAEPPAADDLQGLNEREVRARYRSAQHQATTAALLNQQFNVIKLLITRGADVNARDRGGATALLGAVMSFNDPVASLLLQQGADPNVGDPATLATPLHVAAGRGLTNTVMLLINANAAINPTDARGETPLGHALHSAQLGVAAVLRQRGANLGAERPSNALEQSLAEYFRRTDAALQRASSGEKAQLIIAMSPTRSDVERMFPQHAQAAWIVVEEMRRQIKQSFQKTVIDSDSGKEIWRIRAEAPSVQAREWLERGWLNPQLAVYSLVVDRIGATSKPGDYCYVNQHWVLLPPLGSIGMVAQAPPSRR